MALRGHKLKVKVTLNGTDFDSPSGGEIKKTMEIPTATLRFPNSYGSFFQRFSPRDVFRIYVGKDAIDTDVPNFVGYPVEGDGEDEYSLSLMGRLHACETEYLYIDDYNNYDAWEVSRVIQKQLVDSDMGINPTQFGGLLHGTNPAFFIPSTYRKPEGITRYQFIKYARDLAYDIYTLTGEPLKYILYEHGDGHFILKKQPPLYWNSEWETLYYSDNLLSSKPRVDSLGVINRQTVFSAQKEKVTFNLAHEQQKSINGIHEGKPYSLDFGNYEEAYNAARLDCLLNRAPRVTTSIRQLELIEAVPGITIIRIENAPNLIEGFHRVVSNTINFSNGLTVTCELEKAPPILGKEVIALLLSNP